MKRDFFFLLLVLLSALSSGKAEGDDLLRSQFLEVQGRVREGSKVLKALRFKEREAQKRLELVSQSIAQSFVDETLMNRSLLSLSLLRAGLDAHIEETKGKIADIREQTKRRIRALYMIDPEGLLSKLLGEGDSGRAVRDALYLRKMRESDEKIVVRFLRLLNQLHQSEELLTYAWSFGERLSEAYEEESIINDERKELEEDLLLEVAQARKEGEENLKALRREAEKLSNALDVATRGNGKKVPYVLIPPLKLPIVGKIVQRFGKQRSEEFEDLIFNKGIEFGASADTQVFPVASGIVRFIGRMPSYGTVVLLEHGPHEFTLYGRVNEVVVQPGQQVSMQTPLGRVGEPDRRGRNLYFEIRQGGKAKDPLRFFPR